MGDSVLPRRRVQAAHRVLTQPWSSCSAACGVHRKNGVEGTWVMQCCHAEESKQRTGCRRGPGCLAAQHVVCTERSEGQEHMCFSAALHQSPSRNHLPQLRQGPCPSTAMTSSLA